MKRIKKITLSLTGAAGVHIDTLTNTIRKKVKEKQNLCKYKNVTKTVACLPI